MLDVTENLIRSGLSEKQKHPLINKQKGGGEERGARGPRPKSVSTQNSPDYWDWFKDKHVRQARPGLHQKPSAGLWTDSLFPAGKEGGRMWPPWQQEGEAGVQSAPRAWSQDTEEETKS